MKKLLMLAGVMAAVGFGSKAVVPAGFPETLPSGVTGYTQLTSGEQLFPGMKIVIRCANQNTGWDQVFFTATTLTEGTTTNYVTEYCTPAQVADDPQSIIWTVDYDQVHASTNKPFEGIAFYLKSADGRYYSARHANNTTEPGCWTHQSNGAYNLVYATKRYDAIDTSNNRHGLGMHAITNTNLPAESYGTLFGLAANTNGNGIGNFGTYLAIYKSNRSASGGSANEYELGAGSSGGGLSASYTQYFQVYKVEDITTEWYRHLWHAKKWAATMGSDFVTAVNGIVAPSEIPTNAADIQASFRAAFIQAVRPVLNGKSVRLQNVASQKYIAYDANSSSISTGTTPANITVDIDTDGKIKLYFANTANYIQSIASNQSRMTYGPASTAGEFRIDMVDDQNYIFLRGFNDTAAAPINFHDNGSSQLLGYNGQGNKSQWIMTLADPKDEYLTEKAVLDGVIEKLNAGIRASVWSTDEVNAAVTNYNQVAFNDNLTTIAEKYAEKDRCLAALKAALAPLKNKLDNQPVFIKFNRGGNFWRTYDAANNNVLCGTSHVGPQSVWVIEMNDDFSFNLKSLNKNGYLGSGFNCNIAKASAFTLNFVNGTKDGVSGAAINFGGTNCVHQTTSGDDNHPKRAVMQYEANDKGSFVTVYVGADNLVNIIKEQYGFIGDNYAETPSFGQYSEASAQALTETVDAHAIAANMTASNILDAMNAIEAKAIEARNSLGLPTDNMLFRLVPSHSNQGFVPGAKLHYTTQTYKFSNVDCIYVGGGSATNLSNLNYDVFYLGADKKLVNVNNGLKLSTANNVITFADIDNNASATDTKFVAAQNENGAYQMVNGTNRAAHLLFNGNNVIVAACSSTEFFNEFEHNWNIEPVATLTVAPVTADGWGSYHYPVATTIPDVDGDFYRAYTSTSGKVELAKLEAGDKVAPKAVVLFKTSANSLTIPVDSESTDAAADNGECIMAHHVAAKHVEPANGNVVYALKEASSNPIMLLDADETVTLHKVNANEALPLNTLMISAPESDTSVTSDGNPNTYTLNVTQATTGIEELSTINYQPSTIYDLQGRKVAQPVKGINIVGGRKVLVK